MRLMLLLIGLCYCFKSTAQLTAYAGNDTTICLGNAVILGNTSALATGGTPPYIFYWTGPGIIGDTSQHPVIIPALTATYTLIVIDALNNQSVDNVIVTVKPTPVINITPADTTICQGSSVFLNSATYIANRFVCQSNNFISTDTSTTAETSDTFTTVGAGTQAPALMGNFFESNRSVLLYKASELSAILPGPCYISGLSLRITQFYSNNTMQNYTISMGCTSADSITTWQQNVDLVFGPASFALPLNFTGLRWFNFNQSFYWDGVSDLLIQICNYSAQNGNLQNGIAHNTTPFKSHVYQRSHTNICNNTPAATAINLRPVIAFRYFTDNHLGGTYHWLPDTGAGRAINPLSAATLSTPPQSTNYVVEFNKDGCRAYDTAQITVIQVPQVTAGHDTIICPGNAIELKAVLTGATVNCGPYSGTCNGAQPVTDTLGNCAYRPNVGINTPSIFGNFNASYRNLMLYRQNELAGILPGPCLLTGITFYVGTFNSPGPINNFTVRIGCTADNALTGWNNNLSTVFDTASFAIPTNYNGPITFRFKTGFYWDGISNLLVETCDSNLFYGSASSLNTYSLTNFPSYAYSFGNTYQCNGLSTPTINNQRPDISFAYCGNPPTPNFQWRSSNISDSIQSLHNLTTIAYPAVGTTFYIAESSNGSCLTRDTMVAHVLPQPCNILPLIANAGNDTTICEGSPLRLGAGTLAVNGVPPYAVYWNGPGLNNNTTAHPLVLPLGNSTYTLTVTDANNNTAVDNINILVTPKPIITISTNDSTFCQGEPLHLFTTTYMPHIQGCERYNLTSTDTSTTVETSDTFVTVGAGFHVPALFGNFFPSNRSVMLYKASELNNMLPGPCFIGGMSLRISEFNSNNTIENYTVYMGCTSADSITSWQQNLSTVFGPQNVSVPYNFTGQKWFTFNKSFYWDGQSDLLIQICNFSNQNNNFQNGIAHSATPFKSHVHAHAFSNVCDTTPSATAINLRPVIAFRYFTDSSLAGSYHWQPDTGMSKAIAANAGSALAYPYQPTTYTVEFTKAGCKIYDTITIPVTLPQLQGNAHLTASCYDVDNGSIDLAVQPAGPFNYRLTNSNYTLVYDSGSTDINGYLRIVGLPANDYQLTVADTPCPLHIPLTITRKPDLIDSLEYSFPSPCYPDSNALACIHIFNGTPPYHYIWDTIPRINPCTYPLTPGQHSVQIIDSAGCAKSEVFEIEALTLLTMHLFYHADGVFPDTVTVTASGGTGIYSVDWGDGTTSTFSPYSSHVYNTEFVSYVITVTDRKGCSVTDTVYNFYAGVEEPENTLLQVFPNPAGSTVNISSTKTIQAVTIINNMGRQVLYTPANNNFIMVDIKSLAPGLYLLKIETEGITTYRKLRKTEG